MTVAQGGWEETQTPFRAAVSGPRGEGGRLQSGSEPARAGEALSGVCACIHTCTSGCVLVSECMCVCVCRGLQLFLFLFVNKKIISWRVSPQTPPALPL